MQIKKKKVNITPKHGPITNINPAIRVPVTNVYRSIEDIRKCIIAEAKVEEILNDGKRITLNLQNYDQNNGGIIISVDSNNALNGAGTPAKKKPQPKLRELTKAEQDAAIRKALNNKTLREELTRTADEADKVNAEIKKKEEAEKVIEKQPVPVVEEPKPQQYLSRRQLRKLQEQQKEKEAAIAQTTPVGELAQELNNTAATDTVEIVDPEN
jgi:hypothetical protein